MRLFAVIVVLCKTRVACKTSMASQLCTPSEEVIIPISKIKVKMYLGFVLCTFFSRKLKECQVESAGRPRNKPPPPPRRYRPSSTHYTPSLKQVEPLSELDTKWSKRGLIQRYFVNGQFDLIYELIQGVYVTYICNVHL